MQYSGHPWAPVTGPPRADGNTESPRRRLVSHFWSSTRGREYWRLLSLRRDEIAGPLYSIAHQGNCRYVYPRDDEYFSGVEDPASLRSRLLEWLEALRADIDTFGPRSPGENRDHAFMCATADLIEKLIALGVDSEVSRINSEGQKPQPADSRDG